jgi:pilus assembly protein FimV
MVRKIAFSVWLALLIVPFSAHGLGLGEITLHSALNQPMDADIELLSVADDDLVSLEASMASPELFARYGLDQPGFLRSISLEIRHLPGNRHVIHVSSNRSIPEPFVTMLVELDWARGHMLREYTVLLDPPVFAAQESQPVPTPIAPTPRSTTQTTGTVVRMPLPEQPAPGAETRISEPYSPRALPTATQPNEYMVQRHDTLWELSRDMRPDGTSINRMMIAMFQANPEAFYGNINRLKAGVILRIPDAEELANVNRADANAEVRRHMNEWRGGSYAYDSGESGRLRLVPADSSTQGGAGASAADEALADELADQTTENLVLREQIEEMTQSLDEQDRLIQIKDSELAVLQRQLDDSLAAAALADEALTGEDIIETLPGDDARLADELADELADDGVTDDTVTGETTVTDIEPTIQPVPTVVTRPDKGPTLMDRASDLLGNQWVWIGLGVVLLGFGGLVFARRRRDESGDLEAIIADEPYGDDRMEDTGTEQIRAIMPGSDEGFVVEETLAGEAAFADTIAEDETVEPVIGEPPAATPAVGGTDLESTMPGVKVDLTDVEQTVSGETALNLEGTDPLAEADFHMAYGLYDQAADLVQKALDKNPDRNEYRIKLTEIFFVWGNKDSFLETAQYLHSHQDQMEQGEWDKILIMGKQICPDAGLFSESPGMMAPGGFVDVELEETKVSEVDVDLLMAGDDTIIEPETTAFDDIFADVDEADEPAAASVADEIDISGLAALELGDDETVAAADDLSGDAAGEIDPDATGQTAELNVDDLGLDDELEATGTMQVIDVEAGEGKTGHDTVQIRKTALEDTKTGLDIDLDATAGIAVDQGKTAEMPRMSSDDDEDDEEQMFTDVFGDDDESRISDKLDMDIGGDLSTDRSDSGDTLEMTREMESGGSDDLDHSSTMKLPDPTPVDATGIHEVTGIHEAIVEDVDYTGTVKLPDADSEAETMSEVGTKLDLARAYMDMGDPDGARSILEEVLEEGNDKQKEEAQGLINNLP